MDIVAKDGLYAHILQRCLVLLMTPTLLLIARIKGGVEADPDKTFCFLRDQT